MSRTVISLVAGLAVMGVVAAPSAHAESHFSFYFGTPAPVVVAPPVYVRPAPVVAPPFDDDCYWQPGYYAWVGYDYHWVPGQWVRRGYRPGWDRRWEGDRERWERDRWNRERERDRWRDNDDRDDQGRGWAHDRGWRR